MDKIQDFTDLIVWQKGHDLVLLIYKLTLKFPEEEKFGLTSQIRRASVSVTSNIAEGFSRSTRKDKIHFYRISQGSLTELQNQLIIAKDLCFVTNENYEQAHDLTISVQKLISGCIRSLKK